MDIKIKALQVMELEESQKNLSQENQQLLENISGLQKQIQNSAKLCNEVGELVGNLELSYKNVCLAAL